MATTQVAISFDTTGSMWDALDEVRKRISEIIHRLKKDIPGVKLSVIAHGDYCDAENYVTKKLDFTDDEDKLVRFVQEVEKTDGGDPPECYELVLRLVRTGLSWQEKAQKILIVIGDSHPHPMSYPENKDHIDWKEEAKYLAKMSMRIYGLQIGKHEESTEFFRTITHMSGGSHLRLSEFTTLSDVILAVCYRTKGTDRLMILKTELRARYAPKSLPKDLEHAFDVLHRPKPVPSVPAKGKYPKDKAASFFWADQLTDQEQVVWNQPDDDHHVHSLRLTLATLDFGVKENEVSVVEVDTTDSFNTTVKQPLLTMVAGKDSTLSIDISFSSGVTFRLKEGQGPVYLSGQHVVALRRNSERSGTGNENIMGFVLSVMFLFICFLLSAGRWLGTGL